MNPDEWKLGANALHKKYQKMYKEETRIDFYWLASAATPAASVTDILYSIPALAFAFFVSANILLEILLGFRARVTLNLLDFCLMK